MARKSRKRSKKSRTPTAPAVAGPRPPRGAWVAFLILCVVGLLLSLELERLHVQAYAAPGQDSYCSRAAGFDCETVATSRYSILLGIPLSVWGVAGYLVMGLLAGLELRRRTSDPGWPAALALVLAALAVLGSIALLLVSHLLIGALCLLCVGTYLVNFGLLAVAVIAWRRTRANPVGAAWAELSRQARTVTLFLVAAGVVLAAVGAAIPPYWRVVVGQGPGGITAGVDADGHPWIGAARPQVEIVEYSDYECPHCARGHAEVRRLVAERPDELRLTHRHYPLDQACNPTIRRVFHEHACAYARMAWCAQQQGRFWEANDFLYAHRGETIDVDRLAAAVGLDRGQLAGCVDSDEARREIDRDLRAGREAGVSGTPTFVIDGKTYTGGIPPEALSGAGR